MGCSDPRPLRLSGAVTLALLGTVAFWPARAPASCVTDNGAWSEADAPARVVALHTNLDDEARAARRWRWAWTGINAGLTAVSFGSMPFVSRDRWPEAVVGGIGSALSTALTIAWPLDVEAAASGTPPVDSCEELRALERRAAAYGRDEHDRLRWPWHILNLGVGLAYFAILGFGWHHWESGAWAGVSAFAIGEAQTLTQPTGGTRLTGLTLTW